MVVWLGTSAPGGGRNGSIINVVRARSELVEHRAHAPERPYEHNNHMSRIDVLHRSIAVENLALEARARGFCIVFVGFSDEFLSLSTIYHRQHSLHLRSEPHGTACGKLHCSPSPCSRIANISQTSHASQADPLPYGTDPHRIIVPVPGLDLSSLHRH